MRQANLTVIKGGLNRLRTKGAALNDSLYELLNGYVTAEKTIKVRPGTVLDHTIPSGTFGLVAFEGKFHVFASSVVAGIDTANFVLNVLNAPNGAALAEIHFAEPFLGALYGAAAFADGQTYHYWLQEATAWTANTVYQLDALVSPTVPNGFVYRPTRLGGAFPSWTADTPRALNDRIEPTVYSGFYFTATQVIGANPRSGPLEPTWPVEDGAVIIEDSDVGGSTTVTPPTPPVPEVPTWS
jgi:hypothetical protein